MTTAAGPEPGLAAAAPASARPDRIARLTRDPWWALPFIGLVGMLPLVVRRVGDPDFWWHVRTGQWMVQNHAVARTDLYTYTVAGTRWTDHEYLSQLIFYALNRVGGLVAVSVFFGAVVWGGFLAVFARVRQRAHSPLIAGAALLLGAAAGFPVWGPRPQMFDFLFSAIELYWLERFLSGRTRVVWYLPLLVLLWANLHGGFIFAFFFLGIVVLTLAIHWALDRDGGHLRAARTLVAVGAVAVVAAMLTPNGPSLYLYVWKTQFSSVMSAFIREWQSPDFHAANMLPFAFMLIAAVAGFAWRRPRLHDVLYVVASGALALHAWRFIPIFVVATTPVVAWQWSEPWTRLRRWLATSELGRPREWAGEALLMVAALALIAGVGVAGYTLRGQTAATRANYPVAAADWLAAHPSVGTRMFNEYSWGGYLAYRFYPDPNRRVFIYGEAELVGDNLLVQYADINNLRPDWSALLNQYRVDYVIFPVGTPLVSLLDASSGWHRVYADSLAVIFVRNGTRGA